LLAIEVRGLRFSYSGSSSEALKGVDLSVAEGEFVVIAGPSGCGKSTLIRAINGLIPRFYQGKYSGTVIVGGQRVSEREPHELFGIVGTVFQEPESQLLTFSVERELAFPLENAGIPREEMRDRVDHMLRRFGLFDYRKRSPWQLSGGEQQKVALAAALIPEPKILLLDEPTSNLDPVSALSLLQLVKRENERGTTVVLSEHRMSLVAGLADRLVVMEDGKVTDDGPPGEILDRSQGLVEVPFTIALAKLLRQRSIPIEGYPLTPKEFVEALSAVKALGGKGHERD